MVLLDAISLEGHFTPPSRAPTREHPYMGVGSLGILAQRKDPCGLNGILLRARKASRPRLGAGDGGVV